MHIKVAGFKIELRTVNFFDTNSYEILDVNQVGDVHMVFKNLISFSLPITHDCVYDDEVDKIRIYKKEEYFYIMSVNILLAKICIIAHKAQVLVNRNISDAALQEIVIKKVFPLFCYNTCIALPLHATGVYKEGLFCCFTGYSSAGKTTLATSFIYEDLFDLVSDDVIFLFHKENKLFTYPTSSRLKLRDDISPYFSRQISTTKRMIVNPSTKIQVQNIVLLDLKNVDNISLEMLTSDKHQVMLQSLYCGSLCDYSSDFLYYLFSTIDFIDIWLLSYPRTLSILGKVRGCLINALK